MEIPAATANDADNALLELGIDGWSLLEDAIAKRAWIVGIFPDESTALERWIELKPILAQGGIEGLGEPERRSLGDADWRDSYKAHFHAWKFGRLHWVPIWERETFKLPSGDAVLWLDPGLAFGTGNHETTRLCVERLVALAEKFKVSSSEFRVGSETSIFTAEPGETSSTRNSKPQTQNRRGATPPRVIDAGCGSGILALSAALLGFKQVGGFDNDPEAVRVSQENAALNGLAKSVEFSVGDLISGLAGRQAEIVLANIQADVLMRFAPPLVAAVAPGGALVLSGILAFENETVRATFASAAPGWSVEHRVMGEWSDVLLIRPN